MKAILEHLWLMNRCPHWYDDSYVAPYWCCKDAGHPGLHESSGELPVRWHGYELGANGDLMEIEVISALDEIDRLRAIVEHYITPLSAE